MFFMLKNVANRRFNRSFKAVAMDSEVDDLSSSMTLKAASALFHFYVDIMYDPGMEFLQLMIFFYKFGKSYDICSKCIASPSRIVEAIFLPNFSLESNFLC